MRCHLEHAVKDEAAASEEAVAPIPPVILDDVVGLGLDPPIEGDEGEACHPTRDVDGLGETVGNTEAREGEHAVRDEVAAGNPSGFARQEKKEAYFRSMISTT